MASEWEPVIGLEVHAQLRTRAKLFSSAPNAYGAAPNTQTTEVDLGLPGVLPVVNRRAVELAVRAALALGCEIHPVSTFARKHYFYPDLPKGYQISQYEEPFSTGGAVPVLEDGALRRVPLTRIHLEEDAGKSIHDIAVAGAGVSHVDLNRAGVPLVEIVSEPEIRSAAEAGAYLRSLRSILRALEVSDADMEKGQFRCDANVSVRSKGSSRLGTRVELKNLNSFRFVERALEHEIERQIAVLEEGGEIVQETRLWDERAGATRPMRAKEFADDYRYFPDPDLAPLRIDDALVESVRRSLPELPHERRARYQSQLGLTEPEAGILASDRELAALFEATLARHGDARSVANWLTRDVLGLLSESERLSDLRLTAEGLAELFDLVAEGRVTPQSGRAVLKEMARSGAPPSAIIRERGLEAVSDTGELRRLVDEIAARHPEQVAKFRAGEEKLLHFFLGQVMRATGGKADAAVASRVLRERLQG